MYPNIYKLFQEYRLYYATYEKPLKKHPLDVAKNYVQPEMHRVSLQRAVRIIRPSNVRNYIYHRLKVQVTV